MKAGKVYKDVRYFKARDDAYAWANTFGLPITRIIKYDRGWAIQLRISGPYAN